MIYPQHNLLQWPLIGRFLRWRGGRLTLQLLFLALTLLLVYDGFTGPVLAPQNLATVLVWVHYRGVIMIAFLLFGNLFCMGCPFALPRSLARRLAISGRRWPSVLRHKWLAIAGLVGFLFLYEWLDLFASPTLTAWVILFYFALAFALEAVFSESPFCKYLCPLGSFNFVSSTISPTQITVQNRDVCHTCVGKECINGRAAAGPVKQGPQLLNLTDIAVLGCGTELFAPQLQSNLDCTFCLDCARACPHDNVALAVRHPLAELVQTTWPKRWDLLLLVWVFVFGGLSNTFGMVPPVYQLEIWLSGLLNVRQEGFILLLILGTLTFLLPAGLALLLSWLTQKLSGRPGSLVSFLAQYTPVLLPLAFAIWFTHYAGFHFLSSAGTVIPVLQTFLLDHNLTFLGQPDWSWGPIVPLLWLDNLEIVVIFIGLTASLYLLTARAKLAEPQRDSVLVQLPWLTLLVGLTLVAFWLFGLPMEMRGTPFAG